MSIKHEVSKDAEGVLAIALLLLGCAQEAPEVTETHTPAPEATAETPQLEEVAKEKIVISVIGPMAVSEGTAEKNAAMLAAEEINKEGGILGKEIEIVVGDTKLDPSTATSEFRRLATVENAVMITGGFSSGVMNSMMETMAETKTIFLADASSPGHPAKVAEDYEKYKYWFRISQNNGTTFAWDLADLIDFFNEQEGLNIKKIYIIRDEHIWTDAVIADLTPLLEERGVEIIKDAKVPKGYTDYDVLLLEAQDLNADVIMPILAIAGTGDVLTKSWKELGISILLAGHDLKAIDAEFYEDTNGAAEGEVFIADGGVLSTAPPTDKAAEFLEAYKVKYGHYPESHQAYGAYDALYIYKMAVEAAAEAGEENPFDPDVVVKYLEKYTPENPVTLTRVIAWYDNHALAWGDDFVRNWPSQWQDGKQCIIWPSNVANCEFRMPEQVSG
ncbi:MAG TPA: branched-chain amino acid ABC transporter substrate-binding protein [Archaeoglobaceae archaeon]|nr:branched-chain amino acid ABC transporter substrate-binding protein [Archaeoglobaceae archaeon]